MHVFPTSAAVAVRCVSGVMERAAAAAAAAAALPGGAFVRWKLPVNGERVKFAPSGRVKPKREEPSNSSAVPGPSSPSKMMSERRWIGVGAGGAVRGAAPGMGARTRGVVGWSDMLAGCVCVCSVV